MSGTLDAYANTQYRPVTTVETGQNDPLSVRCYADMASALNNYKLLVGAPRRGQICFPHWETEDNTTDAHAVALWGPLYIPDGYSVIAVDACTRRSAGTSTVAWYIYASAVPYYGERSPFNAVTPFVGDYDVGAITTNSDGWKWNRNEEIVIYPGSSSQLIYVTLVAVNGDASTRSEMSYFSVRAELR
jgi:hypothetical protein